MPKFQGKNPFKNIYRKVKRTAAKVKNFKTEANVQGEINGEKFEFTDCPAKTDLKSGRTVVNISECGGVKKIDDSGEKQKD